MTLLCDFTDDCDVRLELHEDRSLVCVLCQLEDTDDVRLDGPLTALRHLHLHGSEGQNVPPWLFQCVRDLLTKEPQ